MHTWVTTIRRDVAEPLLRVQGLEAAYGVSQALFGVDFEVGRGEVVTLLGRNGMGKTTSVMSVMGTRKIVGGEILFEGTSILHKPSYRIAKGGIAIVPEGRRIFPNLTVRENLIATATRKESGGWNLDAILNLFPNLSRRISHYGNQLSGGEQQMLAIGRALLTNPKLLILDEATEGLAPLIRLEIWRCLEALKNGGLAILVIDKNVDHLVWLASRHFVIEKGKTVWSGTSEELIAAPAIRDRYLSV